MPIPLHPQSDSCCSICRPTLLTQRLRRFGGYAHSRPFWLNFDHVQAEPVGSVLEKLEREMAVCMHFQGTVDILESADAFALGGPSMAHSIESRVPFLDYRLVEFVLGLPDKFKISSGMTKRVLRESMRGVLPWCKIRTRVDKLAFVTPEEVWVREHAPGLFRQKIENTLDVAGEIFDRRKVREQFERICVGSTRFKRPWRIANFGEWIKIFNVRS